MGLLNRLFRGGQSPTAPLEWAGFFVEEAGHAFIQCVRHDLDARGLDYTLETDTGYVRIQEPGLHGNQLRLINLAQRCSQIPRRFWAAEIQDHFNRIMRLAEDTGAAMDSMGEDFEKARRLIKVRLYPPDVAAQEFIVSRSPAAGILAVLVYDFPQSLATVHKDHVSNWGRGLDELFDIGLQNVRADEEPAPSSYNVEGGAVVSALTGDSFFTATRILALEDVLPPDVELGILACVPHRHTLLFHPIRDRHAFAAMNAMAMAAARMFSEGPGSISPSVYWWRDGSLQRQPAQISERGIQFSPTEEFIYQVLPQIRGSES